jgi:hypothetical protein
MAMLKNQSEFTQMAYIGGTNGGGFAGREGVDGLDILSSARS